MSDGRSSYGSHIAEPQEPKAPSAKSLIALTASLSPISEAVGSGRHRFRSALSAQYRSSAEQGRKALRRSPS